MLDGNMLAVASLCSVKIEQARCEIMSRRIVAVGSRLGVEFVLEGVGIGFC